MHVWVLHAIFFVSSLTARTCVYVYFLCVCMFVHSIQVERITTVEVEKVVTKEVPVTVEKIVTKEVCISVANVLHGP